MKTEQRVIKFRAFADFGKFSVMLDEVSIQSSSDMVGLHDEAFKESLEATEWKINDDYQFEHKTTGEQFGHDTVGVYDSGEDYFFFENTKVMQFTGQLDKSGKDIYEGDLWKREDFIGNIVFEFGGWQIRTHKTSKNTQYPSFHSNAKTGEVIGNIYQQKP